MKSVGPPRVITLDAYAASHCAVRELSRKAGCRGVSECGRASISTMWLCKTIGQSNSEPDRCSDSNGSITRPWRSAASSLYKRFRIISLRPASWGAAQPQCRNFGTPCWPPIWNVTNPKAHRAVYKLCTRAILAQKHRPGDRSCLQTKAARAHREHSFKAGAELPFLPSGGGVRFLRHMGALLTGLRQMADSSLVVKQLIVDNPHFARLRHRFSKGVGRRHSGIDARPPVSRQRPAQQESTLASAGRSYS